MRYWAIVACLLSVACTSLVSAQVMLLPAELLPWLGVKEGAGGGYTAQTSVTLPPDLLRLGRPPLFGPPPPLLCNLTLQGQLPSSELDTSTAQTKTGMVAFRVGKGCVTQLRNMGLRVSGVGYADTPAAAAPAFGSSPVSSISLSGTFEIKEGGLLVLENVVIKSNRLQLMYTGICNAWSYSGYAELNAAGELRLAGEHATSTGLLLRNVTIMPAEGLQASKPTANTTHTATVTLPCRAVAVSDAVALNAILLKELPPHQTLHVSLVDNITIEATTWQLVQVVRDASFTLHGDPDRVTQIDFGGVAGFLSTTGSLGVSQTGIVSFYDVVMVNLVAWDTPTSLLSSLLSFLPAMLIRRQEGKLLGVRFKPQINTTRCTIYVPDAEAIWMRAALPALKSYRDQMQPAYTVWSWTAADYARQAFQPAVVTALGNSSKDGVYITQLMHISGYVQLTHTSIFPISDYPGTAPVHPYARRWLLQELLGIQPPERMTLAAITFMGDAVTSGEDVYNIMLSGLAACMYTNRPSQVAMSGPVRAEATAFAQVERFRQEVQQRPISPAVTASITATNLHSGVYHAFGPRVLSPTANCSLLSMPNPRSIPRGVAVQLNLAQYLPVRRDQDIYRMLHERNVTRSTFDLMGVVAHVLAPQGIGLTLGRLTLVNLAPGGYAYDWATSRMLPVDGWAEAQGPLAAGFVNQSLPVWWLQANRSSIMPVLQLYDVVLVVPQVEMELMHALIQAVAVLRQHGLLNQWHVAAATQQGEGHASALSGQPVEYDRQAQPHIRQMLQYAMAWEVEFSSNTSLRFHRWSYLGVAGEGISITSQLPKGYNASMMVSRVADAAAGLLGLAADISGWVSSVVSNRSTVSVPAPPLTAAQGSTIHTNATGVPAQQTSPSPSPPAYVLAISIVASLFVTLLAAGQAVVVIRRRRMLHEQVQDDILSKVQAMDNSNDDNWQASIQQHLCNHSARALASRGKVASPKDSYSQEPSVLAAAAAAASTESGLAAAMSEVRALQAQLQAGSRPAISPATSSLLGMTIDTASGSDPCLRERPKAMLMPLGAALQQPYQPEAMQAVLWLEHQPVQHVAAINSLTLSKAYNRTADSPAAGQSAGDPADGDPAEEHAVSFVAQLHLGPVLGQGARSVVHIGTWNMMPVAVKMVVVVEKDEPKTSTGQRGAMLVASPLQAVLSEVAIATSVCHPNVASCLCYSLQPMAAVMSSTSGSDNSSSMVGPRQARSDQPSTSAQQQTLPREQQQQEGSCVSLPGPPAPAVLLGVPQGVHAATDLKDGALDLGHKPLTAACPATRMQMISTPGNPGTASGSKASCPGAWQLCMVLEYCNGGTLHELIESGTLAPHCAHASDAPSGISLAPAAGREVEVLLLAWQVAVGMDYLARLGVVHGGLSASNVLLHSLPASERTTDFYAVAGYDAAKLPAALSRCSRLAKITGFSGATRLHTVHTHATCRPGGGRGLYTAPELLHGGVLCEACDVYSFGVLLLELWYGMPAVQVAETHGGSLLPSASVVRDGLLPDTPSSLSRAPSGSGLLSAQLAKADNLSNAPSSVCSFLGQLALQVQHRKQGGTECTVSASMPSSKRSTIDSDCSSEGFSLDRPGSNHRPGVSSLPAPLRSLVERCLTLSAPMRPTFAQLHSLLADWLRLDE